MQSIPPDFEPYQRTDEFTDRTVPPGLERRHNTKAGVWARICVVEGRLLYRILEPEVEEHVVVPGSDGVIEPEVDHQVVLDEPVRFFVEFYRARSG